MIYDAMYYDVFGVHYVIVMIYGVLHVQYELLCRTNMKMLCYVW